jgi:pimeloyl-ACP methyl ester carboxylesterase
VAECVSREVAAARTTANGSRVELARKLLSATQLFVDFWSGPGVFNKLDEKRQLFMSALLPKVALDFQALLNDPSKLTSLYELDVPACLIGGRFSPLCSHQLMHVLEAVLPRAEQHWVPAGHLAPMTDAVRVNPVIEAFLQRSETAELRS